MKGKGKKKKRKGSKWSGEKDDFHRVLDNKT